MPSSVSSITSSLFEYDSRGKRNRSLIDQKTSNPVTVAEHLHERFIRLKYIIPALHEELELERMKLERDKIIMAEKIGDLKKTGGRSSLERLKKLKVFQEQETHNSWEFEDEIVEMSSDQKERKLKSDLEEGKKKKETTKAPVKEDPLNNRRNILKRRLNRKNPLGMICEPDDDLIRERESKSTSRSSASTYFDAEMAEINHRTLPQWQKHSSNIFQNLKTLL